MHNYCILWMETLWRLKCHHGPICSSVVIHFPADSIQYTGTHNAEVSTTFITLIPGRTTHPATDQWKQSGLEDLQSSPSPFRLCTNFPWLRRCSSGNEPRHGYLLVGGFPKQEDVEVHCQSHLPLWWIQLCTGFLQSLSVSPLHAVLPGRFAQHSLGHQPASWPQIYSTGEAFCGCR